MKDYIVVGGGMGGALSAAVLSKNNTVLLLEKEPYLGGCASTFVRGGHPYNSGATTFAMYEEGLPVYEMFELAGVKPNIKPLEHSHIVLQGAHQIRLYADVERFVDELNLSYYHPKNLEFWRLIKKICDDFYKERGYIYSGKNGISKLKSAISFLPSITKFFSYLTCNAKSFISAFFGDGLSKDYIDFLDAQTMVAVQAKTSQINFFTAALALGYPFFGNFYANGGMGMIFRDLSKKIDEVRLKSTVRAISKTQKGYLVESDRQAYEAKRVILNTAIFSTAELFRDSKIKNYFKSFSHLDAKQSAFVVYMKVKNEKNYAHHYQIIEKERFSYTISNALFISFSDREDVVLSKDGYLSVTASIHTLSSFWLDIDKEEYIKRKNILIEEILASICAKLSLCKDDIVDVFAATPKTFKKYVGRSSLGGVVMTPSNQLKLISNDTPFEGLFVVGDTSFAAQGWPGVAMGVRNLLCLR